MVHVFENAPQCNVRTLHQYLCIILLAAFTDSVGL